MKIQNKKGFSIVEIMIYLAIFTMLSILVINSFITILASFNTTNMNRKILESGMIAMERMSREIRQTENIDIMNSSLDVSLGVLQLKSTDNGENPMTIKFKREDSGELNLYKNDDLEGNLLGDNLSVIDLVFSRIITTKSEAVRIKMTLQYSEKNNNKTENFYNTIILRDSY